MILIAFVVIGAYGLSENPNVAQLAISHWEAPLKLFAGGMVIFVAYEGFELIANTAPDLVAPQKNIPKAYFYSVGFVIVLYVCISIVTVGSLPFTEIAKSQDYVLAEAAKPMLGQIGFSIITVAALISTFSAINASLYGGSRVNYEIAQDNELPSHFTKMLWNQPIGLLVTVVATLLLVNFLDLESISTAGSVGFLLIFAAVNWVGYRTAKETGANKGIALAGFILCAIAVCVLVAQQMGSQPKGVAVISGIIAGCFLVEWVYRRSLPKTGSLSGDERDSAD